MKTMTYLIVILLLPSLASCQNKAKMKFAVQVMDDEGKPILGCEVGAIIFDASAEKGKEYKRTAKTTNEKGMALFNLSSGHNRLSYGVKAPAGFYRTPGEEIFFETPKNGMWQLENKQFKMILKRKKNPIAMYAKKGPEFVPARSIDIGYDLVVGDWIAPRGKGKTSDIIFHMTANEVSPNEFSSKFFIKFPNQGDGLISFEAPIEGQAEQLRSGYHTPEKNYVNSLTHTWVRKPGVADKNTRTRTTNYYIRVRTKLDKEGNVVSAHYGKIYGDFMAFTHYLNPTPNDRNVEFDPKKNLIDTGRRGHKVQDP